MRANKSFMNKWSEAVEKDDNNRVELERARKQKLISNQDFLREQMDANPAAIPGPTNSAKKRADEIHLKKKYTLGGQMNPEEARMNRELLKEIARAKRGESPTKKL